MLLLTSLPPLTGPLLSPLMAPITVLLPQWVLIILFAVIPFYLWLSYWPGRHAKVIPIRASAFSPDKVPSNLDTIVIGSGSGGSSCSNILAQSGQRVLLLEQHVERTVSINCIICHVIVHLFSISCASLYSFCHYFFLILTGRLYSYLPLKWVRV